MPDWKFWPSEVIVCRRDKTLWKVKEQLIGKKGQRFYRLADPTGKPVTVLADDVERDYKLASSNSLAPVL